MAHSGLMRILYQMVVGIKDLAQFNIGSCFQSERSGLQSDATANRVHGILSSLSVFNKTQRTVTRDPGEYGSVVRGTLKQCLRISVEIVSSN